MDKGLLCPGCDKPSGKCQCESLRQKVLSGEEIRKASPEIMQEIEAYKERIERIRDYTYQVPPKSLLNFAEEMVKEACPAEEMTLREKTLKEILNIIDCYLKL